MRRLKRFKKNVARLGDENADLGGMRGRLFKKPRNLRYSPPRPYSGNVAPHRCHEPYSI